MSMLIDVPEGIETPKMVGFKVFPCVIRLERFDDCDCVVGDSERGFRDADLNIDCILFVNGEANLSAGPFSADTGQLPS